MEEEDDKEHASLRPQGGGALLNISAIYIIVRIEKLLISDYLQFDAIS